MCKRTATTIGMGLLTSALVSAIGCGQEDFVDVSQLPLASEAEAVDATAASGRIFKWVRPSTDLLRCIRPPCPKAILDDVNLGESELTYAYDWRALKLSPEEQASLEADAPKLLLYGKYTTAKMDGESVQIYQVTRANRRVSEQSVERVEVDSYYTAKPVDPSCQQLPCGGYSAMLLNRAQSAKWGQIDISRLGLPLNAHRILTEEMNKSGAYISVQDPSAVPAVVTQVFRPYNATPLPNN